MKVIGINTSHDSAICSMTNGKIDFYHEEARWQKNKWFCPEYDFKEPDKRLKFQSTNYKSLDFAFGENGEKVEEYDTVGFASFDRRTHEVNFEYENEEGEKTDFNYLEDRFLAQDIRDFLIAEPFTRERIDECAERFPEHFTEKQGRLVHQEDYHDVDIVLNDEIARPYGIESYDFLQNEHHLLHAFSVLYQSPFKDALILVCDGGGSKFFHDQFPMYQEMESMFYLSEQDITPLYKHLSNSRAISEFDIKCYDNNYFAHRNRFNLDDAEFDVELSSDLSEGQKFSALSARLGYDYHGRAAGKVMGMASYGLEKRHDCYTPGDLAGRLQSETVDVTAKLIERLIEYKPECKNICLSGGYALNCVANYQYLDRFPNHKFFIDPCAHDGGTAIGSCVKNTFYKDSGYTI